MSRQAVLGLVVMLLLVAGTVGLFAFANLLEKREMVEVSFPNVGNLLPDAPVMLRGYTVGYVDDISLPSRVGGNVTVTLALQPRVAPLVREGTRAEVKSVGLIGLPAIMLSGGDPEGRLASEGGQVIGVPPLDVMVLADRGMQTMGHIQTLMSIGTEIAEHVGTGRGTVGRMLYDQSVGREARGMMQQGTQMNETISRDLTTLTRQSDAITTGLDRVNAKLEQGVGTAGRFMTGTLMEDSLSAITEEFTRLAERGAAVTEQAQNAADWGALGAFRLAENQEAAQHNWLFKAYTERRSPSARAPFELREDALEDSYHALHAKRDSLRAWEARLRARQSRLGPRLSPPDSTRHHP